MLMILDKPYVSLLLSQTLASSKIPVIKCSDVRVPFDKTLDIRSLEECKQNLSNARFPILCNSEYAVASIYPLLKGTPVMEWAETFKNKMLFRETLQKFYPSFFFRECRYEELLQLPVETVPFPLVIKPSRGFRSVGVYLVEKREQWTIICKQIHEDMQAARAIYPDSVVSSSRFILEEWIQGDEYAVDAYYDEAGEPVVLNLFKRMFAHDTDTSDRIYYTGKQVLKEALAEVENFMKQLRNELPLRNFPLHFEVRISKSGHLIPIEVNPLRFAGLCTTDLGMHAFGINVYEYFFLQKKPDWNKIIATSDDSIFSFLCAELPLSIEGTSIESVNDRKFKKNFEDILEYRLISYEEYPTFSVVFYRSQSLQENEYLLHLNLEQYLVMKSDQSLQLHSTPA